MYFDHKAAAKYARDQKKWLKTTGLKVGDRVKVIAKAEDFQSGWPTIWVPSMDEVTDGVVTLIDDDGIQIGRHWFPFFVLVKQNE